MTYALRRYCGMSAREVWTETPPWEIEALLIGIREETRKQD